MHSSRPKLPTACWNASSGAGLPSGRRTSASMSIVAAPRYGGRPRLNGSRVAQRARPVARQPHDVRRAGDVGVELAVRHSGCPAGSVTSPSVMSTARPAHSRPGGVLLQRAERPVAVVEHHADAAGRRQGDRRCPCRCTPSPPSASGRVRPPQIGRRRCQPHDLEVGQRTVAAQRDIVAARIRAIVGARPALRVVHVRLAHHPRAVAAVALYPLVVSHHLPLPCDHLGEARIFTYRYVLGYA